MRNALVLLLLTALASPLAAADSIVASLPAGRVHADVMQPAASPRATELTEKLQSAVRADPERWQENAHRVEWNENLGLSSDEHSELQRLNGDVRLAKADEAEIEFVHASDGRVMLRTASTLAELSGLIVDPNAETVDTSFGRLTDRTTVIAGEDQRALGPWNGDQWTLDAPGDAFGTGTQVTVGLGRLVEDGRGVLFFDAKSIESGKVPRRASYVIVFPLARR